MRFLLSFLILIAATTAGVASPLKRKTMPVAFHGDWVLETRECGVGPSDSGNMRIAARKVNLFESVGKVTRVTVIDPHTIWVESRVTHSNNAYNSVDTFNNVEIMSLSTDKQLLTTGDHSFNSVYKRCAK